MSGKRSFRHSVKLSEAVAAFLEGRDSADVVLNAYYHDTDVVHVIRGVCSRAGLEAEVDDIQQHIGLLLSQKFLQTIKDPGAIYAVIKHTAINVCKDALHRRVGAPEQSLDQMYEVFGIDGDATHLKELVDTNISNNPEKILLKIDNERAHKMFTERMQQKPNFARYEGLFGVPSQNAFFQTIATVKTQRTVLPSLKNTFPKKNEVKTDADLLINIRDTLGILNEHFAGLLGITNSMLCFYLYNQGRNIPEAVMTEAKSIMGQMDAERLGIVEYLTNTPVSDTVELWMVKVGINPASTSANEDLGSVLGVARSTVWRWRSGNQTPKLAIRVRTHLQVLGIEKKLQSTAKNKPAGQLALEIVV